MPLVSIITPTYNCAQFLKRNIESAASQTFQDFEHIIVDNVSSDGTELIVNEYKRSADYPVIYIREPDTGIYQAMNRGLKLARGAWTHILNSDDYYADSLALERAFSHDIVNYDLIASPILLVDGSDTKHPYSWVPSYDNYLDTYIFPHPGLLIRKAFYKRNGYYNEEFKIISDSVYNIQHYHKARYLILDQPLAVMQKGGVSCAPSLKNIREQLILLFQFHRFPLKIKVRKGVQILKNYLKICLGVAI
jgi:glycosyltransferase involved in cell wall biosynthesis